MNLISQTCRNIGWKQQAIRVRMELVLTEFIKYRDTFSSATLFFFCPKNDSTGFGTCIKQLNLNSGEKLHKIPRISHGVEFGNN